MISYNKEDFNLKEIEVLNQDFNRLKTKFSYHVYGLTQAGNAPIFLSRNASDCDGKTDEKITTLMVFLNKNGIQTEADFTSTHKIQIGLRRDVRINLKYSSALIKTIVAFLEGALTLKESFTLPKIALQRDRRPKTDTYLGNGVWN